MTSWLALPLQVPRSNSSSERAHERRPQSMNYWYSIEVYMLMSYTLTYIRQTPQPLLEDVPASSCCQEPRPPVPLRAERRRTDGGEHWGEMQLQQQPSTHCNKGKRLRPSPRFGFHRYFKPPPKILPSVWARSTRQAGVKKITALHHAVSFCLFLHQSSASEMPLRWLCAPVVELVIS